MQPVLPLARPSPMEVGRPARLQRCQLRPQLPVAVTPWGGDPWIKQGRGLTALLFITRYYLESTSISVQKYPSGTVSLHQRKVKRKLVSAPRQVTLSAALKENSVPCLQFLRESSNKEGPPLHPQSTHLKCQPLPNSPAAGWGAQGWTPSTRGPAPHWGRRQAGQEPGPRGPWAEALPSGPGLPVTCGPLPGSPTIVDERQASSPDLALTSRPKGCVCRTVKVQNLPRETGRSPNPRPQFLSVPSLGIQGSSSFT